MLRIPDPRPCGLCKLLASVRRCVGGTDGTYGTAQLTRGVGGGGDSHLRVTWCRRQHKDAVVKVSPRTLSGAVKGRRHRVTPGVSRQARQLFPEQIGGFGHTVIVRLLNYSRIRRNFTKADLLILTKMPPRSLTNLGNAQGRLISWNKSYWRKSPSRLAPNYDTFDSHSRTTGKHVSFVSVKPQTEFHHRV